MKRYRTTTETKNTTKRYKTTTKVVLWLFLTSRDSQDTRYKTVTMRHKTNTKRYKTTTKIKTKMKKYKPTTKSCKNTINEVNEHKNTVKTVNGTAVSFSLVSRSFRGVRALNMSVPKGPLSHTLSVLVPSVTPSSQVHSAIMIRPLTSNGFLCR